jgi:hypothetical protein
MIETIIKQTLLPKNAGHPRNYHMLRIITYSGDGVNLVIFDESLEFINDNYFDSAEIAVEFATEQFSIPASEWEDVNRSNELPDPDPGHMARIERIRSALRRNAASD